MKVIVLKRWPLSRHTIGITLGVVFAQRRLSKVELQHEYIHVLQQREMLWLPFFLWYVVEWLVRFVQYRSRELAYRNISFEREAYSCQHDAAYPQHRRRYAWWQYL